MINHQETRRQIREMREAGDSLDEIETTLGLSWEIVRPIVRRFEKKEILAARSQRFLAAVREADDLSRKWKPGYLVQAVRPLVMTQNAIVSHYGWEGAPRITLLDLMELAISDKPHPKPGFLLTPLLHLRCVGVEGFWSMVGRLTQADLGESCNREWSRRLARLKDCARIAGRETYWSKPCQMPTWVRELVEVTR